jgi:hypothetical protein
MISRESMDARALVRDDFTELPVYGIRKPYFHCVITWRDFQHLDPSHHDVERPLQRRVDRRFLPACRVEVRLAQNLLNAAGLRIQAVQTRWLQFTVCATDR